MNDLKNDKPTGTKPDDKHPIQEKGQGNQGTGQQKGAAHIDKGEKDVKGYKDVKNEKDQKSPTNEKDPKAQMDQKAQMDPKGQKDEKRTDRR